MKAFYLLLLALLTFTFPTHSYAQKTVKTDSTSYDEAILLKEQQQTTIDSLVKLQLQKELSAAEGDAQRTKELEAKLRQIAIDDSLRLIAQQQKLAQLKKNAQGYPVVLNKDTLFNIYTRTGSFSAKDRATANSAKILKLSKDPFYRSDSLRIAENEGSYDIIYRNKEVIVSLGELDGLWFGKSNAQLAKEYLATIQHHIAKERDLNSITNILKRILQVALVFTILAAMVWLVNRLFRKTASFIRNNKENYLRSLHLNQVKIITADHLEAALLRLNTMVKIVLMILITYFSLSFLFSIFPETEGWTGTLIGWILSPLRSAANAIIDYLPDLFKVIVIYMIFRYLLKGIRYLFDEVRMGNIQLRGFHAEWALPTFNILRVLLYAFMLVIIFPYLPGSSSPAFQGVSVFLGILISLGSSSAIGNIVAGLVITYMRPFRIGDRVKIGEVVGDVVEKSMLVTRIRTVMNEDITVPNSMVLSSSTVNYSSQTKTNKPGLIIHYTVTVGYDVPWQQVYTLLTDAALATTHVLPEPKPFVLQLSLDNFYISYQINAYTKEANKQGIIYSNLLENIQEAFAKADIDLASPSLHVLQSEEGIKKGV